MGAKIELRWNGRTTDGIAVGINTEVATTGRRYVREALGMLRTAIVEACAVGVESAPAGDVPGDGGTIREAVRLDAELDGLDRKHGK